MENGRIDELVNQIRELRKEIHVFMHGDSTVEVPGVIVRLDRLEQARKAESEARLRAEERAAKLLFAVYAAAITGVGGFIVSLLVAGFRVFSKTP